MATTMAVGAPVGAATSSWRRAPPTSIVCGATGNGNHCSPGAVDGRDRRAVCPCYSGRSLSAHLATTNDTSQIGGILRPWHPEADDLAIGRLKRESSARGSAVAD